MHFVIEFDPALVQKEDLLGLVTLVVKSVLLQNSNLLQVRHQLPDELLVLVPEELDFCYDVLMREVYNSEFENGW